jgi:hypothetical protein
MGGCLVLTLCVRYLRMLMAQTLQCPYKHEKSLSCMRILAQCRRLRRRTGNEPPLCLFRFHFPDELQQRP